MTTAADGQFVFSDLRAGSYTITVDAADTDLIGYVSGIERDANNSVDSATNYVIGPFTVTQGEIEDEKWFGFEGIGDIGNQVWLDADGDGIHEPADEPGLPNVTVTILFAGSNGLFGDADDLTWNDVTDFLGRYDFSGLPGGNFRVYTDVADLPGSSTASHDVDGTPDGIANVSLGASASRDDVDFGFRGTRTVQGQVWLDRNSNDTNGETNEPGLGGITVELTYAGTDDNFATSGNNFVVTTVTDANGNYTIDNLVDGNYRVTTTAGLPLGVTATSGGGGIPDGIVDFNVSGANPANQNLGYLGTSTISDFVWFDHDGDGIQNAGTVGLADVQVTLVYTGADGIVDGADEEFTLTVDTDDLSGTLGRYAVDNLPGGIFQVSIDLADPDLPAGLTPFASAQSYNTSTNVSATGIPVNTVDFGLRGTRIAAGDVFFDGNANGNKATINEDGFAAVTLNLVAAGQDDLFGTGDDFAFTIDTAADGSYAFSGLIDGDYRISLDTADIPGVKNQTYDIDLTLDDRGDFTLAGSRSDVDFGYRGTSSIGDRIWYDLDSDGLQESGEFGVSNKTVFAVFAGLDGLFESADDLRFQTTTSSNGAYSFANLLDGNYRVNVEPFPPVLEIVNTVAPDDGVGTIPGTSEITLAAFTIRADVDLGFSGLVANNSFLNQVGFDRGVDYYSHSYLKEPLRSIQPLPVDPIYSGLAEPGTTLLLKIFDEEGREIGSRTVLADTGGNWIASFPGTVIWENPHAMTVETIGAIHTLGEGSQYNTRRYFQPALHPSMFFAPRPTVQSVMQQAPSQVLAAIHEANQRPLQFGTTHHSYDLNVASNSTAGN
jgi:hypothetical protein